MKIGRSRKHKLAGAGKTLGGPARPSPQIWQDQVVRGLPPFVSMAAWFFCCRSLFRARLHVQVCLHRLQAPILAGICDRISCRKWPP